MDLAALRIVGQECDEAAWALYQTIKGFPRPRLSRWPWFQVVMRLVADELDLLDVHESHDEGGYHYDIVEGPIVTFYDSVIHIDHLDYETLFDASALTINGIRCSSRLGWLAKLFNELHETL